MKQTTLTLTLDVQGLHETLRRLADAAEQAHKAGRLQVASEICGAVATLIGAARMDSRDQTNLMDFANTEGFRPEYYVNSIRVHLDR